MKFAYWKDGNNNIINYNSNFKYWTVREDTILTAVYVDENVVVTPQVCFNITNSPLLYTNGTTVKYYSMMDIYIPDDFSVDSITAEFNSVNGGQTTSNHTPMSTSTYLLSDNFYSGYISKTFNWGSGEMYIKETLIYKDTFGTTNSIYDDYYIRKGEEPLLNLNN